MKRWQLSDVIVTRHANEVRERRSIPWEAVAKALSDPSVIEPHEGRWRVVRGRLALVMAAADSEAPVVVTMLLRGAEDVWDDDHARSVFDPR